MNDHADQIAIETELVVNDTLETLILIHSLRADTPAARELHAAATLARVARSRLCTLVADARDQDVTWQNISRMLGTTRLWAILRYGPVVRRRRTPLTLD
jgi:hypothetical protein